MKWDKMGMYKNAEEEGRIPGKGMHQQGEYYVMHSISASDIVINGICHKPK